MLYAVLNSTGRPNREVEWHVGEKLSYHLLQKMGDEGFVCSLIQADGHELEHVKAHFENVPFAHKVFAATSTLVPVQKWRGDFAAFIFDHLPVAYDK